MPLMGYIYILYKVRRNRITKEITGKLVKGLVITFWGRGRDFPLLSCKRHDAGQRDLNFFNQIAQVLGPKRVAIGPQYIPMLCHYF